MVREFRGGSELLIGLVVIIVLTRLWLGDSIESILRTLIQDLRGEEGLSSTSYALATFATQIVYGVGVVAVAGWSGLWAVVQDVFAGVRQWAAGRVQTADEDVLRMIDQNLATLQDQIDRMKAESTWSAARKSGADDGQS